MGVNPTDFELALGEFRSGAIRLGVAIGCPHCRSDARTVRAIQAKADELQRGLLEKYEPSKWRKYKVKGARA